MTPPPLPVAKEYGPFAGCGIRCQRSGPCPVHFSGRRKKTARGGVKIRRRDSRVEG